MGDAGSAVAEVLRDPSFRCQMQALLDRSAAAVQKCKSTHDKGRRRICVFIAGLIASRRGATRRSLEQFAIKQEQMAQNIATLQAASPAE